MILLFFGKILDTRDIKIKGVSEVTTNAKLEFKLAECNKNFGTALSIDLSGIQQQDSLKLNIVYETSPSASALQWLGANCTCGKECPYLFSQCQAIHARSIMPCQDTPFVKFTYDALVRCQKPLIALMSAVQTGSEPKPNDQIEYKFTQKIKIPSYLLAIVVGKLVGK